MLEAIKRTTIRGIEQASALIKSRVKGQESRVKNYFPPSPSSFPQLCMLDHFACGEWNAIKAE
ncbi:hypothetical protein BZZ01_06560 [Nostocales cyanobacterium HT-58-2]|nr:hypothetical protein BZZ01_06560 [Nostocales cyanobacterium HT-58-2]